jgi:hypothetical protein
LPNSKDPAVRQRAAERERQACELRLCGATYAEIGARLGMTSMGACKYEDAILLWHPRYSSALSKVDDRRRLKCFIPSTGVLLAAIRET